MSADLLVPVYQTGPWQDQEGNFILNRGVGMTTTCLIKFSKNKNEKNIVNVLKAQKKTHTQVRKLKSF